MNDLIKNMIVKRISKNLLNENTTNLSIGDYFKILNYYGGSEYGKIIEINSVEFPYIVNSIYSIGNLLTFNINIVLNTDDVSKLIKIEKKEYDEFLKNSLEKEGTSIRYVDYETKLEYVKLTLDEFKNKPEYKNIVNSADIITTNNGSNEENSSEVEINNNNFHAKLKSKTYDPLTKYDTLNFEDGTSYFGNLKDGKIHGWGTFQFDNLKNKISGNFETVNSENGFTYKVKLDSGVIIRDIFNYESIPVSQVKTLNTPLPIGSSADKSFCESLKNYYVQFLTDIGDELISLNDNEVYIEPKTGKENNEKIKEKLKTCYKNFKGLFTKKDKSILQNPDPDAQNFKVVLENNNFKYLLRKSIINEIQKKQSNQVESKIIKNRFDFILNEKENRKKLRYLFEEKNTLIEKGYNKDLVIENYNKSIKTLSQSHQRLIR